MKKILMVFIFSFLLIGLASAEMEIIQAKNTNIALNGSIETMPYGGPGMMYQLQARNGIFVSPEGEEYSLEQQGMGYRLMMGENISVNCSQCNLTQERIGEMVALHMALSNGKNAEIKVMPSRASEIALMQLRLHMCNNTCEIELKEVGEGNKTRVAYEFMAEKRLKFLGIFGSDVNVTTQIDAETGEVISTNRPWWSFLASEKEE